MRKLIASLFFVVLNSFVFAQGHNCDEDLFPKKGENRLYGYANLFGVWRVNPIFTATYPFQGNVGKVLQGLKYGAVNCDGKLVIRAEYEEIGNFIGGLAWVKKEGKWGLVNDNGEVLLEPQYDEVKDVSRFNDFTWVREGKLWGLYDKRKKSFVRNIEYPLYQVLVDSTSLVKKDGFFGVISHNTGKYLVQPKMENVKKVAPFTISYKIEGKWGVVRDDGTEVLPAVYDSVALAGRHRLILKKDGKYGMIDPKGNEIAPLKYDHLTGYEEGAAKFKLDGKYGFISYYGKEAIPAKYEEASMMNDFRIIVKESGKYGVIDRNQKVLIEKKYKQLYRGKEADYYVTVDDSNNYQCWNLYGTLVSPLTFDTIYYNDDQRKVRVEKSGAIGFFNTKQGNFCFDKRFDAAQSFTSGFAIVAKNEKWGVVNDKGDLIVTIEHDSVKRVEVAGNLYFLVRKGGNYGVYLNSGKAIVPVKFDKVSINQSVFVVESGGKKGLYNTAGELYIETVLDDVFNVENTGWVVVLQKGDESALMNDRGDWLMNMDKQSIVDIGGGLLEVKRGKKSYLYNTNGNLIIDEKYDAIGEYEESLLAVKQKKNWGYIDSRGRVKIDFQYDEASSFQGGKACVVLDGDKGEINRRGDFRKSNCDITP